jgi:hypothetical protein
MKLVSKGAKKKSATARSPTANIAPSDALQDILTRIEILERQVSPIGRSKKLAAEVLVIGFFAILHWGLKELLFQTQSNYTWWAKLLLVSTELNFVVSTVIIGVAEVLTVIVDQWEVVKLQTKHIKRIWSGK